MNDTFLRRIDWLILPLIGAGCVLAIWAVSSATWAKELPSPIKTWQSSKPYLVEPFAKRGEMDQGILRFTWYSLVLVAKGYALAFPKRSPRHLIRSSKSCDPSRRWRGCRWDWSCF